MDSKGKTTMESEILLSEIAIPALDHFSLDLPKGSQILDLGGEPKRPLIYLLYDRSRPYCEPVRHDFIVATAGTKLNVTWDDDDFPTARKLYNRSYVGRFKAYGPKWGIQTFFLFQKS